MPARGARGSAAGMHVRMGPQRHCHACRMSSGAWHVVASSCIAQASSLSCAHRTDQCRRRRREPLHVASHAQQRAIDCGWHCGVPGLRRSLGLRYILTIKALHELDPTGLTLSAIGDPIRKYLRERKDTVRCIVEGASQDRPAVPPVPSIHPAPSIRSVLQYWSSIHPVPAVPAHPVRRYALYVRHTEDRTVCGRLCHC